MGLVQVNTTTITSDTKTSSLTLTGINTDDVYLFAFNNMNVEADITLFLRFTISGSPFALSNYAYARKQINAGASFSTVAGASQTAINMQVVTDTTCYGNGMIYLYDFNNSSEYSYCNFETSLANTGYSDTTGSTGGGVLASAGAADGIALVTSSGYEINSGTYTLYKVT
tara:strand:- start:35 stop:544 length:510 start_codon:yes stop_codon:yes gene_type:complete